MIDALLIYPRLGNMDTMVVDPPLSIIYAATDAVKRGYRIECLDLRCVNGDWQPVVRSYLEQGVRLAGISVMTGAPLKNARQISRFIRAHYPDTKVVWGGPHVTILPETIQEDFLDFVIRGYGSRPLAELIAQLRGEGPGFSQILGLSYKQDGEVRHNPRSPEHEMLHFRDLPYHLLDLTAPCYGRAYAQKQVFPMFSAIGCPYQCTFCMHPAAYREINPPKWRPYPPEEVVDHIQFIIENFGTNCIAFIDDTSFPDLARMRRIFELILERGLEVEIHFRGARVNEIDRMDDEFLALMVKAGGRVLMVGAESGSNAVLKRMQKGITKAQLLRVNRKLARYPQLTPVYNMVYGTPGETYQDLVETKETILQLIRDNPNLYVGVSGDWKPIPGSKMLELAEREYGFRAPQTLDEWIEVDTFDSRHKLVHPWYTKSQNNMIKLLQISSFVIDDKIIRESAGNNSLKFRLYRALARIYKPIAMFRLKHNLHQLLVEYSIWRGMLRAMSDATA